MMKFIRLLSLVSLVLLTACSSMQDSIFGLALKTERAMSDLKLYRINAAEHEWEYLDSETKDKPVLLLLHGFGADKDNWIRFSRHLPEYRVIIPDLPGHGETSFNENFQYDFFQQAVWLDDFINKLELDQVHIAGNSMGGAIALSYGHDHPERVKSIILMDSAGVFPVNKSEFEQIIESGGKNPLIVNSKADFEALSDFAMEQPPFLPWPAHSVLARRAQERNDINHKIFSDMLAMGEETKKDDKNLKMLEEITPPVLVIWGQKDRVLDVASVAIFEQHLPNSRSIIYPDVGHTPMLEVPKESAADVKKFIEEIEAI